MMVEDLTYTKVMDGQELVKKSQIIPKMAKQ